MKGDFDFFFRYKCYCVIQYEPQRRNYDKNVYI